jgi:hypothetical protein
MASGRTLSNHTISLILGSVDKKTLASCLRVSRTFYEVAGPLLYRHLSITPATLQSISSGSDITTHLRATRGHSERYNFKKALFEHTTAITLYDAPDSFVFQDDLDRFLPFIQIDSLRITPPEVCRWTRPTIAGISRLDPCAGYGQMALRFATNRCVKKITLFPTDVDTCYRFISRMGTGAPLALTLV